MEKYDVIIIGAACAGLTSGLYTSRRALKTLIISKDLGGQAAITTEIENYPGTGTVTGPALMNKFKEQAETAGAELQFGEVTGIKKEGEEFVISSSVGEYQTKTVILAFGLEHRKLGVEGELKLIGKGVTYCATCDGPLFKGKTVTVVGGGNSAFDAAEYLSELCEKVYLMVRTDKYRAEQVLIDAVKSKENIEILDFTQVKEFVGEQKLEKAIIVNSQTKEERDLEIQGAFIEIGWVTKTEFVKDLVTLNERGFITTDNESKTSTPGIYAAGDVTDTPFKQAVISAGEGAKAALSAAKYIQEKKGQNVKLTPDLSSK